MESGLGAINRFQFILDYDAEAFTLFVAVPSICSKSASVIRLLECSEQLCDIVFKNIVSCRIESNAAHHLKNVSFVKGALEFENYKNVVKLIVLDYLIDCIFHNIERIIYQRITSS